MKQKIQNFLEKHGFSYQSYVLALIVFPPAGVLVAWKIPNLHSILRIALSIIAIALPPAIVFLSGLLIANLI